MSVVNSPSSAPWRGYRPADIYKGLPHAVATGLGSHGKVVEVSTLAMGAEHHHPSQTHCPVAWKTGIEHRRLGGCFEIMFTEVEAHQLVHQAAGRWASRTSWPSG